MAAVPWAERRRDRRRPALPDTWSETQNVAWRTDLPGLGWSSPVIWDNHIFITSAISAGEERAPIPGLYDPGSESGAQASAAEHRWMVYDIDFETGAIRWARELHRSAPPMMRHLKNSYASETAVTDGQRVYVFFGSIGLVAALTMEGDIAWTRQFDPYNGRQLFGTAASPVLHDGRLYVVNDNKTQSYLAALTWRPVMKSACRPGRVENWSTPLVLGERATNGDRDGRTAKDSRLRSRRQRVVVSRRNDCQRRPEPFSKHGLVYISSGYPGGRPRPVYAIRPGATGDISLREGENEQRLHRLVSASARHIQHLGPGLW